MKSLQLFTGMAAVLKRMVEAFIPWPYVIIFFSPWNWLSKRLGLSVDQAIGIASKDFASGVIY